MSNKTYLGLYLVQDLIHGVVLAAAAVLGGGLFVLARSGVVHALPHDGEEAGESGGDAFVVVVAAAVLVVIDGGDRVGLVVAVGDFVLVFGVGCGRVGLGVLRLGRGMFRGLSITSERVKTKPNFVSWFVAVEVT